MSCISGIMSLHRQKTIDVLYFCIYDYVWDKRMTVISDDKRYEWDSEKNDINKKKHGLSLWQLHLPRGKGSG